MKKSKILIAGLIGLLMAGALVLAGCDAVKCHGGCEMSGGSCNSDCTGYYANSSSDSRGEGSKPCRMTCPQP